MFNLSPEVVSALVVVLCTILVDTGLGVTLALKEGTFDIRKLPRFLETAVLPYVGSLVILALGSSNPEIKIVFFSASGFAVLKYIAEIKDKVQQIFGADVMG